MYKAVDVARYIVNYTIDNGGTITNLKLQKILYFVQGFFLILKNGPCFSDKIEAWDFGPVVPSVYFAFKEFGANSIPKITKIYKIEDNDFFNIVSEEFDDSIIENCDKELINTVVDIFSDISATSLVNMTHNQRPWIEAYDPRKKHQVIRNETIKDYFSERYLK